MDCRTGDIYEMSEEQVKQFEAKNSHKLLPLTRETALMLSDQTPVRRKNYMRNQQCVCGSGKKFKRCCWGKYA